MVCDVCIAEMNASTTEMEVSVKEKMINVVNVPSLVCPKCKKLVGESLVEEVIQKCAKHCKEHTFDYNDVKLLGFGFGKGIA